MFRTAVMLSSLFVFTFGNKVLAESQDFRARALTEVQTMAKPAARATETQVVGYLTLEDPGLPERQKTWSKSLTLIFENLQYSGTEHLRNGLPESFDDSSAPMPGLEFGFWHIKNQALGGQVSPGMTLSLSYARSSKDADFPGGGRLRDAQITQSLAEMTPSLRWTPTGSAWSVEGGLGLGLFTLAQTADNDTADFSAQKPYASAKFGISRKLLGSMSLGIRAENRRMLRDGSEGAKLVSGNTVLLLRSMW